MNLTPFLTVYARRARTHIYGLKENQLHIYMADKMDEPVWRFVAAWIATIGYRTPFALAGPSQSHECG